MIRVAPTCGESRRSIHGTYTWKLCRLPHLFRRPHPKIASDFAGHRISAIEHRRRKAMFLTNDSMKMWIPTPIRAADEAYWRFVGVPLRTPWFVVTIEPKDESQRERLAADTILVHFESDLRAMLESNELSVVQVLCVAAEGEFNSWNALRVREIWRDDRSDEQWNGTLLFALGESEREQLCNSRQETVISPRAERTLLFRLASEAEPRERAPGTKDGREVGSAPL